MKNTLHTMKLELAESAQSACKVLSDASAEAIKTVAHAAEEAARVVSAAAAAAATTQTTNIKNNDDHDTITTLVGSVANIDKKFTEKFAEIRTDIKDLKGGTSIQIADHETRINALESSKTKQNVMMSIGIGLMSLLVSLLIYHMAK